MDVRPEMLEKSLECAGLDCVRNWKTHDYLLSDDAGASTKTSPRGFTRVCRCDPCKMRAGAGWECCTEGLCYFHVHEWPKMRLECLKASRVSSSKFEARTLNMLAIILLLVGSAASYFALHSFPKSIPFHTQLEYFYDLGAFYSVDLPYHSQIPNPTLRFYFNAYLFMTLITLLYFLDAARVACCGGQSHGSPASSTTSARFFVRTDTYMTMSDAQQQQSPISTKIMKVDGIGMLTTVNHNHTKSE